MQEQALTCKVCDQGTLIKRRMYRLSGPIVLIGYLFLLSSVGAIVVGLLLLFYTGATSSEASESIKQEIRNKLTEADVPPSIVEDVLNRKRVSQDQVTGLSPKQMTAFFNARQSYRGTSVASNLMPLMALIYPAFGSGLLGLLLTMRKKVLLCPSCSAVVNAS